MSGGTVTLSAEVTEAVIVSATIAEVAVGGPTMRMVYRLSSL